MGLKKFAILIVLVLVVVLTACGRSGDSSSHEGMDHSGGSHSQMPGMDHGDGANDAANVQAKFTLSDPKPQPNQDTTLTINIQDKKGKPIEKFDVAHEKLMHLILVSKDLSFFNHIHPDYKGNGQFTVTTQFPAAGEYKVIADITPTGMKAMHKDTWLTIEGNPPAAQPIKPDQNLTKVVDGKEVTLSFDHVMANMDLNMNFNIKDAKTKKPVTDLQPYLGAVGHVVVLSQDTHDYLHVHPMDEKAKGPDARFMTNFPHSGVFKVWGQFQQNGKVFTVPFTVNVP